MRVLTVNAGSSSLKLRLLQASRRHPLGFERLADFDTLEDALAAGSDEVDAVGHRIVHGGPRVQRPTVVDARVLDELEALNPLAPIHQPAALAAVRQVQQAWPAVIQIVCPDTAFHADLPAAVITPPLPREWIDRWQLRRYGFHGLSVQGAARRVHERYPDASRLVVAHLGSGASITAVRDGHSIDTTMGFTPLDGLVMATRSGSVDPGMVLWLAQQGMSPDDVLKGLDQGSGLLGLTGSADMREVLARRADGDLAASLGYEVWARQLRAQLAAMVAALEGIDALVLTGGVAEGSATVRSTVAQSLAHLGLRMDESTNARDVDRDDINDLTAASSPLILLVPAREDIAIARSVSHLVEG